MIYYPTVWRKFSSQYRAVNVKVGVDRVENISWRINNIVLPKSVRSAILHCFMNKINNSRSDGISFGPFVIARSIPYRYQNTEVIANGLSLGDIN